MPSNPKKNPARQNARMDMFRVVPTSYTSLPVDIPDSFLAPLQDPSVIETNIIDFAKTPLPAYKDLYAVVLDNVLSRDECNQLLKMAEMSAGAHTEGIEVENCGWRPAMVNAGVGQEFMALDYRNSDRIIWDNEILVKRLWQRVLQGDGIKEYISKLEGEKYRHVLGDSLFRQGIKWRVTEQGINERMRFLKYGAGQFFREHCDSAYGTPDGLQRSFYTLHLYLNDSAQALGLSEPAQKLNTKSASSKIEPKDEPLRGGATTFHIEDRRLDVDPKIGRVLIFQHQRLLHSGDDVTSGIKYTVRSDIMFDLVQDE